MTHLGRGVDELELDLLQSRALGVLQQRLAQGDDALLGANAAALDHDEVVVDLTIVGEATHGGDALVSQIVLGGGVVLDDLQTVKISLVHRNSKARIGTQSLLAEVCDQSYHYKYHGLSSFFIVRCR